MASSTLGSCILIQSPIPYRNVDVATPKRRMGEKQDRMAVKKDCQENPRPKAFGLWGLSSDTTKASSQAHAAVVVRQARLTKASHCRAEMSTSSVII